MAKYQRLRDLRENNNLTQKQLAKYLNVSQSTYARYETGSHNISVSLLVKLSDLYDVSVEYILKRTDNPKLNK